MESLALNSTILAPRGFRSRVNGPREGLVIAPRRLWGGNDIAALREAPFVRVVEGADDVGGRDRDDPLDGADDQDVSRVILSTVVALALAGVPVTGQGLPDPVRERLDRELLEIIDRVAPTTTADPAERELTSLELRRRAWQVAGYRPPTPTPPVVLVLVPEGDHSAYLAEDLAAQLTPGFTLARRTLADGDDAEQVVREERERGGVYVTRMDAGLRYGPHHLADLVHALSHSGARVALSPRRFVPWQGAWLEDGSGAAEAPTERGLPGGSLWYAVDGASEPVAGNNGYAVHGSNAVPAHEQETPRGDLAPLRLHRGLPRLLTWLGAHAPEGAEETGPADHASEPAADVASWVGASYFAGGNGAPDLARSSATASEI